MKCRKLAYFAQNFSVNHIVVLRAVMTSTTGRQYIVSQKIPPPAVFWNFFPNGWEFLINFLHTYYMIISTLEYKILFKYLQL